MRILVTGANGQLGNEMQVLAKENPQHTYYFTDVQELDICNKDAVWAYIAEKRIELIVNCAEQDRDLFFFKLPQELFVPMRRADRVGVHAQDLRSGEQSVQLLLDLLRTGADVLHDAAALRAAFIGRLTVAAVMAHQPSVRTVIGHRNAAARTLADARTRISAIPHPPL